MSGGLSEEEAIRDFGNLGQLACEILGACHGKPDFRKPAPSAEEMGGPKVSRCKSALASLGQKGKDAGTAAKRTFVQDGGKRNFKNGS